MSKLKAQLRQTKRLLAREDLTPDVRTTSERRLATLELELERTTRVELEKKMVTRYRGIRFFGTSLPSLPSRETELIVGDG